MNRDNHIHIAKQGETLHEKSRIIRSDNMTPAKSPEEFWERFMEESRNKYFDYDSFIRKVARGLTIEWKIDESGKAIFTSQSVNPNYHTVEKEEVRLHFKLEAINRIEFNCERLCIPPDFIKKFCDERKKCQFVGMDDEKQKQGEMKIIYSTEGVDNVVFAYERNNKKCIKSMKFINSYIE